jgi:hypothetical protein
MSANIANANTTNTANTANTNDGAPQVSILTLARLQEKRRQLRQKRQPHLGKQYPSVGTHHRNTKHVWLFSELAEVSAAYKEHHKTMSCWKVAEMLHYSFSEQLEYNNKKQEQEQEQDQDQPIAQLSEPRIHLPSIQAIQTKLLDCFTLQYKDTLGYASHPTQMHKQVWEHIELAEKHRAMLKKIKMEGAAEQPQPQEQDAKPILNPLAPVWNVHPTSFYIPDAEIEAAEPPAKRRKVMFDDEEPRIKQEQEQEQQPATATAALPPNMSKQEFDAGVAELVSLLEQVDDARRQERALIQRLVIQIREHNDQIGSLVSNIKDSHAEIEQHHQAIAHKMQQIETIILPVPLPTPAVAPATPAPQAMVCNKCTKTITAGLGGFSVCYADPSHPDNGTIECDDCAPISPASRKFVEQREAELQAEFSEMERAVGGGGSQSHHRCASVYGYNSDSDDDMYMNDGYYPGFGGCYYDHAEECS